MQLGAVNSDADAFVIDVTTKALSLAGFVNELKESLQESDSSKVSEILSNLDEVNNQFVISLQFFDEYSQRINHVIDALKLVDDDLEGDALDAAVSNIFATRSEHKVLEAVFGIKRDAVNDKESANVDLF
ncbi:MAG: hypothetical protein VW840_16205 [Gammaproteobacteria bacterium]